MHEWTIVLPSHSKERLKWDLMVVASAKQTIGKDTHIKVSFLYELYSDLFTCSFSLLSRRASCIGRQLVSSSYHPYKNSLLYPPVCNH